MKVVPGADGWPEAFDYTVDGKTRRIAGEAAPGVRRVLHLKLFHPLNDHYGLSPIEAAASAVDIHNTASRWNKALLDNSARPSGALVYTARDGNLTLEQYDRLKAELEQGFQGAARAGRPLLLEGGLDWKSMSISPKDMDFIEAKHVAAREIALALGVPPMLLGIPGDNTCCGSGRRRDRRRDRSETLGKAGALDHGDARPLRRGAPPALPLALHLLALRQGLARPRRQHAGIRPRHRTRYWPRPRSPTGEPSMTDTTAHHHPPRPDTKWWAQSVTIWGVIITTLATVLPTLGPLFGLDITAELIRQLGDQIVVIAQALGGLIGTILTIWGRARATTSLERKQLTMNL